MNTLIWIEIILSTYVLSFHSFRMVFVEELDTFENRHKRTCLMLYLIPFINFGFAIIFYGLYLIDYTNITTDKILRKLFFIKGDDE